MEHVLGKVALLEDVTGLLQFATSRLQAGKLTLLGDYGLRSVKWMSGPCQFRAGLAALSQTLEI